MTHRFHPLFGQELEFVKRRKNYGVDDRVYVYGVAGELVSLPAEWTDVVPVDSFVEVAAGRAPFRAQDLLELSERVAQLVSGAIPESSSSVRQITP